MFTLTDYNVVLMTKIHKKYKINKIRITINEIYIYNDIFKYYNNLTHVSLTSYTIMKIGSNIFNNLVNLRYVTLNFPYLIKYSKYLFSNLELELVEIRNGLMQFNQFQYAKSIRYLKLINTKIVSIVITENTVIEHLYIEGGKLIEFVIFNSNFKTIIINYTKLNRLLLSNLNMLSELNLGFNKLSKIKYLYNLPNLLILKLNDNMINEIIDLKSFINLIYLNLNNNIIIDTLFLNDCENLIELHLQNNLITSPIFTNLYWLEVIDISNNTIQSINELMFNSTFSLRKLDLTNNVLVDIDNNAFRNMSNLTNIIIDNNPIKQLPILKTIFDDDQNVHDSLIQTNLVKNILNLQSTCTNYQDYVKLYFDNDEIQHIIMNTEVHVKTNITLLDALNMVCERFYKDGSDISILKELMNESRDKCFTGQLSAIVFSRCGIDNDIEMQINAEEEIIIISSYIQRNDLIINKRKEFINKTKNRFCNNLIAKYINYFN